MDKTHRINKSHPYLESGYEVFPVIKVLSGPLKGRKFHLNQPEYRIGRDPKSHIVIEDDTVSNRHAMILMESGEHRIADLGSTNGVFVNNKRLGRHEKSALKSGDVFQIGSCIFQFIGQGQG